MLDAVLPARFVAACLLHSRRACQLAAARNRQAAVQELLPVKIVQEMFRSKIDDNVVAGYTAVIAVPMSLDTIK